MKTQIAKFRAKDISKIIYLCLHMRMIHEKGSGDKILRKG